MGIDPLSARLRLGPLYEQAGDTASAVESYREVISMWESGDAEAQTTVRRFRERVEALGGGR